LKWNNVFIYEMWNATDLYDITAHMD